MSFWSPIRIDELCESYGSGKTLDQIARDMGTSRGSVIGKWNRLVSATADWPAARLRRMCDLIADEVPLSEVAHEMEVDPDALAARFALLRSAMGEQAR